MIEELRRLHDEALDDMDMDDECSVGRFDAYHFVLGKLQKEPVEDVLQLIDAHKFRYINNQSEWAQCYRDTLIKIEEVIKDG